LNLLSFCFDLVSWSYPVVRFQNTKLAQIQEKNFNRSKLNKIDQK